jgi:hypothetical protein
MTTKIQLSKEQLAERYATLKLQKDAIDKQLREAADELICLMGEQEIIRTPEYSVSKNQGRKVTFWTEAGKPQKAAFEQELLKQGLMATKMGESYIQVRWARQADNG